MSLYDGNIDGIYSTIQCYPRKFAVAVPICGEGDVIRAFLRTDILMCFFHGIQDQIVRPEFSRTIGDAIQLAGGSPGFTEYSG
ncbi:hypothetical protein [Fodinibius saliphilus]|uniref:hypothetical protein n=1 Tax=Fodinibius saliphilus TaxID=1920650 RepID=UPI0014873811|nr:hypothetical protein [Fodinibius saliphilus]